MHGADAHRPTASDPSCRRSPAPAASPPAGLCWWCRSGRSCCCTSQPEWDIESQAYPDPSDKPYNPYERPQPPPRPQPPQPPPRPQPYRPSVPSPTGQAHWAFALKAPGPGVNQFQRPSSKAYVITAGSSQPQEERDVHAWLDQQMMSGQRWDSCLLYSDQPPKDRPSNQPYSRGPKQCAHAKGVVLWSRSTGRVGWLVHSYPLWPDSCFAQELDSLPPIQDAQLKKGQSCVWLVLPIAQLEGVVRQLRHMQVRWPSGGSAAAGTVAWPGAARLGCSSLAYT